MNDRAAPRRWDPRTVVLLVIVIGIIARVALAASTGLGVDESYAAAVARPFSLSYFDDSPLSFWMAGVVEALSGGEQALALRLPFILLFAGTTWAMYRLGARMFGEWAGAWTALLLNIAPVFGLSTASWVLPDGPLMLFLLATALCLERVIVETDGAGSGRTGWWLAAGLCWGLALLSKYHAALLAPAVLVYLVTARAERPWLRRPGPYLAALTASVIALPVVIWNARHHWASFRFQSTRGVAPGGLHPLVTLQNIGGQVGYLLPWIWVPLIWVTVQALRRGPHDRRRWFLVMLAIWPIALFTLVTLGGQRGLPHWEAPGYLFLFPLLGDAVARRIAAGRRWTSRWLAASAVAFVLLVAVAASQVMTGWVGRVAGAAVRRGDPTLEMLDWDALRGAVTERGLLPEGGFIGATGWIDAGKIAHAIGPRPAVVCLCDAPHQFGYQHRASELLGRDALVVARAGRDTAAARALASSFRGGLAPAGTVTITRGGSPAVKLVLYRGRRFVGPYPTRRGAAGGAAGGAHGAPALRDSARTGP